MWHDMKLGQRLVLESLSDEITMVVLWRYKHAIVCSEVSDEAVLAHVESLKTSNIREYLALNSLIARLGRVLALALVQIGLFVQTYQCSFLEYLEMYDDTEKGIDKRKLFHRDDFTATRDCQRSIFTVWRFNIEILSRDALCVLKAIASSSHKSHYYKRNEEDRR